MGWRRGQAYSQDLRDRVLAAGGSAREVAARFGVSISYVIKARQRRERCGEAAARPQCSHTPRRLADWHDDIAAHVRAHPDATIAEVREWLLERHGIHASMGLVWNTLSRLGLTLKKRMARPVCKRFWRLALSSLRQRIRPVGRKPRPRWRSARPGPHKLHGVERHFFDQGSETPVDCQAISLPPPAESTAGQLAHRMAAGQLALTPLPCSAWR